MKKVLIPEKISLCTQCPHVYRIGCISGGIDRAYYGCLHGDVKVHEFSYIPDDCPLEEKE